jgi:hypothetical protein
MGFKSHAQRANALQKVKDGTLSQKQFDVYEKETPDKLPHHVGDKKAVLGARSIPKPRSVEEIRRIARNKNSIR